MATVYPTDHCANEEIPSGNVFVGACDIPFAVLTEPITNGNVVNALWSLHVFLDGGSDGSDGEDASIDLLVDTPVSPPKKLRTLRS
jgi:hypothetical protein